VNVDPYGLIVVALAAVLLLALLRNWRPDLAVALSLAAASVLLLYALGPLRQLFALFADLAATAGLKALYLGVILRVLGIALICELASQVCRDAGEGAVATKVELVGKVMILTAAVPVMRSIVETVVSLWP